MMGVGLLLFAVLGIWRAVERPAEYLRQIVDDASKWRIAVVFDPGGVSGTHASIDLASQGELRSGDMRSAPRGERPRSPAEARRSVEDCLLLVGLGDRWEWWVALALFVSGEGLDAKR